MIIISNLVWNFQTLEIEQGIIKLSIVSKEENIELTINEGYTKA